MSCNVVVTKCPLSFNADKEMRDETTNEKIKVQKMVYKVARRELHNKLISPVEEGGFAGARNEKGEVLISLTSFERYFPNWVVKMIEWYKQMCCCHLCNEPEHTHRSTRLVRLRLLRLLENQTWSEDERATRDRRTVQT